MILFVFEGKRREPYIFKALKRLYWSKEETVVTAYGCNIYALYNEMQSIGDGADIVDILRLKYKGSRDNPFDGIERSDVFSEKYLIFDYDFHDLSQQVEALNVKLGSMLQYFNEETENGKLYINYPMVEAIRYTKLLEDKDYFNYSVTREECRYFKNLVDKFSAYPNADFLIRGDKQTLCRNWDALKHQNVAKANFICNEDKDYPDGHITSISQTDILKAQISKFEIQEGCRVSILSAFPILLYDWEGK